MWSLNLSRIIRFDYLSKILYYYAKFRKWEWELKTPQAIFRAIKEVGYDRFILELQISNLSAYKDLVITASLGLVPALAVIIFIKSGMEMIGTRERLAIVVYSAITTLAVRRIITTIFGVSRRKVILYLMKDKAKVMNEFVESLSKR